MKVKVFNDSGRKYLPQKKSIEIIVSVFKEEGLGEPKVNLIFVDKSYISKLNARYLNHRGATDVITFRLDDDEVYGEIYICPEVAEENANRFDCSLRQEVLRLVAHGALHLAGYEDNNQAKRQKMHKLENKYIKI